MGHYLGPSPSIAATIRMIAPEIATRSVTRVVSASPAPAHPAILAGALDSPVPGDVSPGFGVEFNGWILPSVGQSIAGVLAIVDGERGQLQPLHVSRPDVANDYPSAAALNVGFSFWCAVPRSSRVRIQLVSLLAKGDLVPLLDVHVVVEDEPAADRTPETRLVTAPDFVIVGAQRGGTTSLHAYLRAHPDIAIFVKWIAGKHPDFHGSTATSRALKEKRGPRRR